MSKDPLALAAITGGPPQEAEYDAVYAAVTATERGRWFLSEFANRIRQADMHQVIAALARIEASVCGDAAPQNSAALWRDLTGVAAAVEQARTAVAAERKPASEIAAAVERIQDVSFSLRERALDASLFDTLDAALAEISAACADKANDKPANAAAALLSDLADRVDELLKLALGGAASSDAAGVAKTMDAAQPVMMPAQAERGGLLTAAADDWSQVDRFATELGAEKKSPGTMKSLAASLASAASAIGPHSTVDDAIDRPLADAARPEMLTPLQANGGARWHIEAPDFFFQVAAAEPEQKQPELLRDFGEVHALLPEAQMQSGALDDPIDIFETAAGSAATPTLMTPAPDTASTGSDFPADLSCLPLAVANGTAERPTVRSVPSNRLASLRGLSEDELNALFG